MAHQHTTIVIDGETYCDYFGEPVAACDEAESESLELGTPAESSFTVTCNECGYSGSMARVKLHSCQIQQQGGRCEDFPCCGHTDGDGCQTLPEHTAEYWHNLMAKDPDLYDQMDAAGAWDR